MPSLRKLKTYIPEILPRCENVQETEVIICIQVRKKRFELFLQEELIELCS